MDRGGLALRLNTTTFSPISEESLGWLAGSFQRKKDALDRTRLAMLQTVGYCIPDAVYSEMATAYPRLLPLLDRLKREGRRSPLEATLLAMERRGPYGEAPSVYRDHQPAIANSKTPCDAVRNYWPEVVETTPDRRAWNPFSIVYSTIEPWTVPSHTQMRRLESELPVYQSHRAGLTADRSIHRLSAAAAAIYFLESIPHENRTHLRRIILDEKDEAVSNSECYTRGLILFVRNTLFSESNDTEAINIDFDLNDYKEHVIGEGRGVKAASYIECKLAGSKQAVWGVGIHEDMVHSFLIAFLSAASNENDIPSVISVLEEKANGM
ncbi:hypothetical protein GCG54_00005324 [Colletotrichum gloeosporioides]|uniref:2-isopropylmalate synthase LeuA allosteric (dimerisation) domain-containing protein n=1 Tax=Colletotrichum gloeosporioides TaxID=474922 RepID=A0A8H4FPQ3_COLGL|nr:uncharacterized protein GCG54_00005324 [Colletotrichum gloeosporioides]KAF3809781.1 hypothetical protein GCG54_00005324 [Colletotrichum gloeosporioides]